MLAERRRKPQWVLNPRIGRGKFFTEVNGNSTFGQKMLEKMGWSKGKGLGKNEDGNVEHIRVKYKNDNAGMGFAGNDGNWLENQSEFGNLLASLQSEYCSDDSFAKPSKLAVKSKSSKHRLHYHKMIQGKDLSCRSKEDLQCILGVNQKPSSADVEVEKSDELTVESDALFSSKESVHSYFLKLKTAKKEYQVAENVEEIKTKKKKKTKVKVEVEYSEVEESRRDPNISFDEKATEENTCSSDERPRKRKKNKRKKLTEEESITEEPSNVLRSEGKRRKVRETDEDDADEDLEVPHCKHRKRRSDENISDEVKENLPYKAIPPSSLRKKSKFLQLKLKRFRRKKYKMGKWHLANNWSVTECRKGILHEKRNSPAATKKRVHFSDEVTVHTVAKHDEVRGGALREFLQNWDF